MRQTDYRDFQSIAKKRPTIAELVLYEKQRKDDLEQGKTMPKVVTRSSPNNQSALARETSQTKFVQAPNNITHRTQPQKVEHTMRKSQSFDNKPIAKEIKAITTRTSKPKITYNIPTKNATRVQSSNAAPVSGSDYSQNAYGNRNTYEPGIQQLRHEEQRLLKNTPHQKRMSNSTQQLPLKYQSEGNLEAIPEVGPVNIKPKANRPLQNAGSLIADPQQTVFTESPYNRQQLSRQKLSKARLGTESQRNQQAFLTEQPEDDKASNKSRQSFQPSRSNSAHSNKSQNGGLRIHDFESAAYRAKLAFEQAQLYEKKIENRVNYLANEEQKYMLKILATRQKASKIQDLKNERDRVMQHLLQGKKENEQQREMRQKDAKSEYEGRQSRKLQSAYESYVKLKSERENDRKLKEQRMLELSKEQNRILVKNYQQAEALRVEKKTVQQGRQMNSHLKEIIAKGNEQERTVYYTQQLEATYQRIELLEEKERRMLNDLQTTMKEHSVLVNVERQGKLNTEIVDQSIQKFNLQIKQEFKYY